MLPPFNNIRVTLPTVYAIGDIHGEFGTLLFHIRQYNIGNCGIIACGDIGLGFYTEACHVKELKDVNKKLKEHNIVLFLFRGNHDDPAYFNRETPFIALSNIKIIPDYTVITATNQDDEREVVNILCVGGGISVDRIDRKTRMKIAAKKYQNFTGCSDETAWAKVRREYWEDENVIYDEQFLNDNLTDVTDLPIHCVCTHTCPSFIFPTTKNGIAWFLNNDGNLEHDLNEERGAMDKLHQWLKAHNHPVEHWYYGHFHMHNNESKDGIQFHLIDMVRPQGLDFGRIMGY